jgi:hypothetical protein
MMAGDLINEQVNDETVKENTSDAFKDKGAGVKQHKETGCMCKKA